MTASLARLPAKAGDPHLAMRLLSILPDVNLVFEDLGDYCYYFYVGIAH